MGQPIVHFEIGCRDRERTTSFYSQLFDWQIDAGAAIHTGGGVNGQITALGHEPNNYTIFYVRVDDLRAAIEKAKVLGGKTLVEPVPIPTGTFAWIADPEGNIVGLFKPK